MQQANLPSLKRLTHTHKNLLLTVDALLLVRAVLLMVDAVVVPALELEMVILLLVVALLMLLEIIVVAVFVLDTLLAAGVDARDPVVLLNPSKDLSV